MQLKDCELASKNASYMAVIAQAYARYQADHDRGAFKRVSINNGKNHPNRSFRIMLHFSDFFRLYNS